jgi:hypothetical protein
LHALLLEQDLVLHLAQLHLQLLLLRRELPLHADEVFVELVLSEDVASYSLVETVYFYLLELKVFVLAFDELEALLQLQLEERVFVRGGAADSRPAVFVCNAE